MILTCPNHGSVEPRLQWFQTEDGVRHLGGMCRCGLVLRWLSLFDATGVAPSPINVRAWP
jgi:hypothetical protein